MLILFAVAAVVSVAIAFWVMWRSSAQGRLVRSLEALGCEVVVAGDIWDVTVGREEIGSSDDGVHRRVEATVQLGQIVSLTRNVPRLHLTLYSTSLHDAALRSLKSIQGLESLLLPSEISDVGLAHLDDLPNLQDVYLGSTRITDQGVRDLVARFPALNTLDLGRTAITDRALDHLVGCKQLENLVLRGTRISDDGVRYLGRLRRLKKLYLNLTPISDTSLSHLAQNRSLEFLDLNGTNVTAEGVAALRRQLPVCRIEAP